MKSLFDDLNLDKISNKIKEENKKYNNIHEFIHVDPFPWDLRDNIMYLRYFNMYKGISIVSMHSPRFKNGICTNYTELEKISYARYLMSLKENRYLESWEIIYHLNGNEKDDRLENLKIIDTRPIDIEVKYPYDTEKYKGRRVFNKRNKVFKIYLYLIDEYRYLNALGKEREFNIYLHVYIAETEKLKRFLNKDEKVIFIDGDKTNCNIDNLKVLKEDEEVYR